MAIKLRAGLPPLFSDAEKRKHPKLFLPRFLAAEASAPALDTPQRERARQILRDWANLAEEGHLNHKETRLDADFLGKIFGDALGYKSVTESPEDYHREKQYSVPGAGIADGALGRFPAQLSAPVAIIELKGAETDLDHDRSDGRTPVRQCWDYLNQLPDTPWGIVSNYVTIRLYHRSFPQRAYEEFTVKDFRDEARTNQFFYLFERYGLLGNRAHPPRALTLLGRTQARQLEVGDELYNYYSHQRLALIELLITRLGMGQDQAIAAAQRLLDRVIFMAFCEDRGLLPADLIEETWKNVPPLARATNPRWRNFLDAFHAIDKGNPRLDLSTGYNGGLFRYDPIVDELDLEDRWADVFKNIGRYDFRDEVNVEVLGHLFERSITELEKLRVIGLFGTQAGRDGKPFMPKSAERKRFGIYYTPPQFTELIVERTIGALIQERIETIADLTERVTALRNVKCCDPACGSGAFLIAAYDRFEDAYDNIAREMRIAEQQKEANQLQDRISDYILHENLYGVDLSAESVEITQLALWIRSARKGKTLADLSSNIICGNSLIRDGAVDARAFQWVARFPGAFGRDESGFDAVIGNPPWERVKMQEREFFSLSSPEIASAVSAADRRKLIARVERASPELWQRYQSARANAERQLEYLRASGAFPLAGRGDVNTYMLFAELARQIVAPQGRVGLLVPSGIATDDTTKHFFADLMEKKALVALYDFENRELLFPDVDGRFKFCVLLLGGAQVRTPSADFVFFAHKGEDLNHPDRHIQLTDKDLKLLNPNTRTCPIFRCRRDADLTKRLYRTVPILVDKGRRSGGNPWGISFVRMFDQTNDAELFRTAEQLKDDGFRLEGNRWIKRKSVWLPLYEAKMIQAFDHRAAGVRVEKGNWMRQGQTEETSLVEHQNPEFVAMPRFWVVEESVVKLTAERPALLAYKDVTSATNQRTMIAAMVPTVALMNSAPFVKMAESNSPRRQCCLLANLNAFVYDFIARQKVGGLHLNFFIVEQLPTLPPDRYDEKCPWAKKTTLENWIAERVLKLTCTSEDMVPFAEASGFAERVHKWKDEERALLRAELDAAYFYLYGIKRPEIEYVLGTFQGIRQEDEAHDGISPTRRLILDAHAAISGE